MFARVEAIQQREREGSDTGTGSFLRGRMCTSDDIAYKHTGLAPRAPTARQDFRQALDL